MALNDKQQRFVDEYLKDLNATQAAIRAGYSAKTAYAIAEKLLRKVEIQQAVQDAKKARSERTEINQDRVLQELARLAFFDPRKMFHGDGSPKAIHELDDDTAAAVSGLNVVVEHRKFRGWHRPGAEVQGGRQGRRADERHAASWYV